MKKRVLLIVLGAMFALPLTAQESWVRFYEAEDWEEMEAQCVIQTSDGGYAIYAYFYEYGVGEKVWLLMTSPHGDTLWTKKYDNKPYWGSDPLIESADGNWVLTGANHTGESYDVWLCKAGAYGDVIWECNYGEELDEYGKSVQQTTDGGYIITGYTYDLNLNKSDVLLIKTDAEGDTLWTRTYGIEGVWASVCQTSDGGYVTAGSFGPSQSREVCLFKTDYLGQEEWRRTYGEGWALCMEQTTDNGYIIAANAAVFKTDSAGDVEWTRDFGAECVRQTFDNGYVVSGIEGTKLVKLDSDGNVLWEKVREFNIRSTKQTADSGYVLTGSGGYFDDEGHRHTGLFLCKTDSTGYAPEFIAIAEPVPVTHHSNWKVVNSVDSRIVLRYTDRPQGFAAFIFDATGSKVDEIYSTDASGSISWGEGFGPGVYFIRVESGSSPSVQKVLLVK